MYKFVRITSSTVTNPPKTESPICHQNEKVYVDLSSNEKIYDRFVIKWTNLRPICHQNCPVLGRTLARWYWQQKVGFAKDFIGAFIASPGDGLDFRYCVAYGIGIDSSTRTVGLLAT